MAKSTNATPPEEKGPDPRDAEIDELKRRVTFYRSITDDGAEAEFEKREADMAAREVALAEMKKAAAAIKPTNRGGTEVTYDWDAIEKELRSTGKLASGEKFDHAKWLYENSAPSPTRKYKVTAKGPETIQPVTVFAVDEGDACRQLRMGDSHIKNENAHRYNVRAVLAV